MDSESTRREKAFHENGEEKKTGGEERGRGGGGGREKVTADCEGGGDEGSG